MGSINDDWNSVGEKTLLNCVTFNTIWKTGRHRGVCECLSSTCRELGPRGLRNTTSRISGSRLSRMSKMMTSQADTELSMLANTKYNRCCLRKGLWERGHFGLSDSNSSANHGHVGYLMPCCYLIPCCFPTILFLPRRSWKRRRKAGSPRLQSGWSMSSAGCPTRARTAEEGYVKYPTPC